MSKDATPEEGIVVLATGGFFDVSLADGAVVRCKMRGRLKRVEKKTDLCVIGDQVRIERPEELGDANEGFEAVIVKVLDRRSVFSRRHPGRGGRYREDVLVANLDQLVVVFGHSDPPFHPKMLDRFLVIAEHNELDAIVVANKTDVRTPESEALFARYTTIGYPVLPTCATKGEGLGPLRSLLDGKISALAGPSGAGKSSLANALDASLDIRVAEISAAHGKGRHTTRVATLHRVADGWLADTPGIRELGAWKLPDAALDDCFPEFRAHLGQCGYRDCAHRKEPRCAIKEALERGEIHPDRYESYCRIFDDEER